MSFAKRHISAFFLAAALFVLPSYGQDQDNGGVKQDTKDAAHSTAQATKKTGRKIKHGTKKVVHKGAQGTKKAAQKTEDKTQ